MRMTDPVIMTSLSMKTFAVRRKGFRLKTHYKERGRYHCIGVMSESVEEANIVEEFVEGEKWKTPLLDAKDEDDDQGYQECKSVKRRVAKKKEESRLSAIYLSI